MNKQAKVYVLKNLAGEPFYVGVTITHVANRLKAHLADARTGVSFNNKYKCREIVDSEFQITCEVLDIIEVNGSRSEIRKQCLAVENKWIKKLSDEGHKLTNIKKIANKEVEDTPEYIGMQIKVSRSSLLSTKTA